MHYSRLVLFIAPLLFITSARGEMESKLEDKGSKETITLTVNDTQVVFDELSIKYSSYGHEHVSYSPGEPFAATVGVYVFLLSDRESSEAITLYLDAGQKSAEATSWKDYSITLMESSEDQRRVVLEIAKQGAH
jgi:hypothetical protein